MMCVHHFQFYAVTLKEIGERDGEGPAGLEMQIHQEDFSGKFDLPALHCILHMVLT